MSLPISSLSRAPRNTGATEANQCSSLSTDAPCPILQLRLLPRRGGRYSAKRSRQRASTAIFHWLSNITRNLNQRFAGSGHWCSRSMHSPSIPCVRGEVPGAAYDRTALGQTGSGHFSPLGGYHAAKNLVLMLDVARFKYPAHWMDENCLWQAMQRIDPTTNQARGWMVIRASARRSTSCSKS